MSGEEFRHDAGAARQAQERVGVASKNMSVSLQALTEQVGKVAAAWDSTEQEQYAAVHHKVNEGLENMAHTLQQITDAIEHNNELVARMRGQVSKSIAGH